MNAAATIRTLLAIVENLNSRIYMLEADDEGRGYESNIQELFDQLRDQLRDQITASDDTKLKACR